MSFFFRRELHPRAGYLLSLLLLAAGYWALGNAGLRLGAVLHPSVSTVWPSTGYAIALLLLGGYRQWPAILAGAIAVNVHAGAAPLVAAGIAAGNSVGALLAAFLLKRVAGFEHLGRFEDAISLILLGAVLSTTASAGAGIASLWLSGMIADSAAAELWLQWWIGDMVGALVVTPFLLAFSEPPAHPRGLNWYAEALGIMVLTAIVTGVIFGPEFFLPHGRYPLAFLPLPLVIWASMRFEARGAAAITLLIAAAAILGTARGYGPFAVLPRGEGMLVLSIFNGVLAVTALIIAASSAERRQGRAVQGSLEMLRRMFELLPIGVRTADKAGRILESNAAAGRIRGAGVAGFENRVSSRRGRELIPVPPEQRPLARAIAKRETVAEEQLEIEAIDGTQKIVLESAIPLPGVGGDPAAAVEISQDITRHVRAEQSLRELAAIAEQTGDIVYVTDRNGIIEYVNPACEKHTGYSASALVGRSPRMFRSGKHDQAFFQDLWETILGGKSFSAVLTNRKRSGETYYELKTISPIRDAYGEITHFVSTGKDITERIRAEERLGKLARARAMMLECNRVLVHAEEEAAMLADMCRLAVELGGYRFAWIGYAEHDEGKTVRPVAQAGIESDYLQSLPVSWGDNDYGRGTAGKAIRTAKPSILADALTDPDFTRLREPARKYGFCSVISVPFKGRSGLLGVVSFYAAQANAFDQDEVALLEALGGDIAFGVESLRSRAERDRENETALAELKAALDEHAIVAVTDRRGKITHVNDKFCTISKYSRVELIGQDHRIINSGHHPKAFFRELWATISSGRVWKGEIRNRAKDGTFYWVDTSIVPFLDERAKPIRYIAIRTDITEVKRAQERIARLHVDLQQRASQLEAANKELESFSYSVSHDLRAPLRHVQGYIEMLQQATEGRLPDKALRYLKTVKDASVEMGELIDDLLAFSRMGRAEMRESRVPLEGLVQGVIRNLETATQGRNIAWKVSPLPEVIGDPSMLKQVLVNLLSNGVKYTRTRDPAEIELGCAGEEDGRSILFVRDNGVGFDMKYVHKLFGIFQRLHRADEFEGTGVGLANVHRIITRHGGRVWAEAALDRGATFFFTLKPSSSM